MITTRKAAALLNLSPRMVRIFIVRGQLPAEKFGRDWLIREDDLELVKVRRPVGRPRGKPTVTESLTA